jgi:uncharacterized tellurite resistance protein B-like protein
MAPRNQSDAKRELAQNEREAIIDLLHFCMYGDAHIALKESEFVSQVVDTIGWPPNIAFSSYEAQSISRARAAKESAAAKREFLAHASARLKDRDVRSLAGDLCKQMMMADGSQSEKESAMLADIGAALE